MLLFMFLLPRLQKLLPGDSRGYSSLGSSYKLSSSSGFSGGETSGSW